MKRADPQDVWASPCGLCFVTRLIGPYVETITAETELAPRIRLNSKELLHDGADLAPMHQSGIVTKIRIYDAEKRGNELMWAEVGGKSGLRPGDTLKSFKLTLE